jgi:hypothetical protein
MVIILDTRSGRAYNFRTRKSAGLFIGVSQPTLREWLKTPFFLHKFFIITETTKGKQRTSEKMLAEDILVPLKPLI